METRIIIEWLKSVKFNQQSEDCQIEFIIGEDIINDICDYLTMQRPRYYKDIQLFGSLVHVDFLHPRIVKICEVTQICYF